jgi:hypothetical protein
VCSVWCGREIARTESDLVHVLHEGAFGHLPLLEIVSRARRKNELAWVQSKRAD